MKRILGLLALAAGAVFAQTPSITQVLDGGAYTNNVAQGSVIIVKGANLSASGYVPAASAQLPNNPKQRAGHIHRSERRRRC